MGDNYYPFGLTFNSNQRVTAKENKYLFNGIERQTELNLGWDLAEYRSYSPEIGRWHQIDPKTSERESPFVGMGNNPIFYSDPLGDTTIVFDLNGNRLGRIDDDGPNQAHFIDATTYYGLNFESLDDNNQVTNPNRLANQVREASVAFIGKNTVADAESIAEKSIGEGLERASLVQIGDSKELRMVDVSDQLPEGSRMADKISGNALNRLFDVIADDNTYAYAHSHRDRDDGSNAAFPSPGINRSLGDYEVHLGNSDGTRGGGPGFILSESKIGVFNTVKVKFNSRRMQYEPTNPPVQKNKVSISYDFFRR